MARIKNTPAFRIIAVIDIAVLLPSLSLSFSSLKLAQNPSQPPIYPHKKQIIQEINPKFIMYRQIPNALEAVLKTMLRRI